MIRVLVDSKLMAYNASYQRRENILATLTSIEDGIQYMLNNGYLYEEYEVIMGFDFGKSSYRKGLLPTYKGHRTEGHKNKTDEELKAYDDFQKDYRIVLPKLTAALGIRTVGVEGVEYDDLASIMAHSNSKDSIIIMSEDHDMFQLTIALPKVSQFMPKSFKLMKVYDVKQLEKVNNKLEFLVAKTIKGDYGDAIKGLNMCGEVCYNNWFNNLNRKGMEYQDWKDAVVKLANSNSKYKIHKHYIDIGITTFEDFFDFNMKLGETMIDTKLLEPQQLKDYRKVLTEARVYRLEVFKTLTKAYLGDTINEFGDPVEASTFPAIRGESNG